MNRFIPEIYKRLGTTVSVDLGAATKLGEIDEAVDGLDSKLDAVRDQQDADAQLVGQRFAQLDGSAAGISADVKAEAALAAQRHQVVLAKLEELQVLLAAIAEEGEGEEEPPETGDTAGLAPLSRRSIHVIRLLNELQGVVLRDKAPAQELAEATEKAFAALDGDPELQEQLTAAYGEFRGGNLAERSDRYWKLHVLIENVAAYWATSGANNTHAAQAARAAASV